MRDANGRATGITGVAGRNTLFDAAGFLDAPNGGKANLPMDVIVASQKVMLRDLREGGSDRVGRRSACGTTCIDSSSERERRACGSSASAHGARRRTRRRRAGEADRRSFRRFAITTATSGWTTRTTASDSPAAAAETSSRPAPSRLRRRKCGTRGAASRSRSPRRASPCSSTP